MPQAQDQATGVSPLKVFGKMLKFFRNRAGLTSDELGALVHLSGSAIRKIESGRQAPIESLVDAWRPSRTCTATAPSASSSTRWPST
jgi:transcriptional regulator with XRE-family HTH domain